MKRFFYFLLFWCMVHIGYGQTEPGFNLLQTVSLSENSYLKLLTENPAMIHMMVKDSSFIKYENRLHQPFYSNNSIHTILSISNINGDYHFHQGNQSLIGGIYAHGEKNYKNAGTLYGSATYLQGNNHEVLLNYAINPEDYFPYLVSDTMESGKLHKEIYKINGGFGFNHRQTYWGVYGEYEGIVASKLTDPKLSIYNSWFRFTLGLGTSIPKHVLSFYIKPEFNRQRISSGDYKHSSVKYLQFYGFGEWSRKESKSGYNYDRIMFIKGVKLNASFKRKINSYYDWNYLGCLNYLFQHMNTEENSYKNLFATHTHQINGFATLFKRRNQWSYYLMISGGYAIRKGTENIYANKEVSEEQGLYDYKKVGENHLYKLHECFSEFKFKAISHISPSQEIHLGTGGKYLSYNETYLSPYRNIQNKIFLPALELSYYTQIKQHQFKINTEWEMKLPVSNTINNPALNKEEKIIIQQSYIPYLIRGESAQSIQVEGYYGYQLKNSQTIGGSIRYAFYTRNKTSKELSSPILSGEHKQTTLSCSLFYKF